MAKLNNETIDALVTQAIVGNEMIAEGNNDTADHIKAADKVTAKKKGKKSTPADVIADTMLDTTPLPEGILECHIDPDLQKSFRIVLFGKNADGLSLTNDKDKCLVSVCEAIRVTARAYKGERRAYVASLVDLGVNKATVATQWQKGRK